MNRYICNILVTVSLLFVVVACNDVIIDGFDDTGKQGYLSLSLGVDDEVLTKAQTSPGPDMVFSIDIKGNRKDTLIADHRTLSQEKPLVLPVGEYEIKAESGSPSAIGFDKPYYVGQAHATVKSNINVNASLVCQLANAMVQVEFDNSIKENFKSYSVFVEDGNGSGFNFSSVSGNLDKSGYLPAGDGCELRWHLVMVNESGDSYVASDMYENIEARHCYKIKFSLSDDLGDSGYSAIKLVVDTNVTEQNREIELDFSESELPSFEANEGFDLSNEMSVLVGSTTKKELTFSAPEGIASFIIAVDAEVQTRAAMKWYELVDAQQPTIDELAAMGIKVQSIAYGDTSATVDITDYIQNLPTGKYNVDVTLYDIKGHPASCPMDFAVISDVDADMDSVSPWAKFAVVKAKYFAAQAPEGTTFMYRKKSESSWASVATSALEFNSDKTFTAEIGGLAASTSYIIKAVSAADTDTREVEFTTGSAENVYNMSFEEWYQDGKVWYPYAQGASPSVWDSANKGAATFIGSSTTPADDGYKGKGVRMESKYAVIAFAAGNLYTGKFGKIDGVGAQLEWGVEFKSRPVALKGYYKYSPAAINRTGDGMGSYSGQTDKAQITIALADWSAPFQINTKNGQFVDFNDQDIIAFGRLESEKAYSDYVEFTIPLEYRYTDRMPRYIVISAAASYLGDYFTGGEGSTLYIDELSFEYDVTRLTDEQKAKVKYK